jgi:hypothetical protein
MPREFTDTAGVHWRVFDVTEAERRRTSGAFTHADLLRPSSGWLCFESESEVRRLMPVPPDWERTDELNLEYYCSRAERVQTRNSA